MVIKVYVGPKEKAYYEKMAEEMGWNKEDAEAVIMEDVNENFFDKIQQKPNGIEFVETEQDFSEDYYC